MELTVAGHRARQARFTQWTPAARAKRRGQRHDKSDCVRCRADRVAQVELGVNLKELNPKNERFGLPEDSKKIDSMAASLIW